MVAASVKPLFFSLLILFSIITISTSSDPDCVYTVYLQTGSRIGAGTDSNITITLYDSDRYGIRINNLKAWGGLMGPGYNYFERGNLDIFSGRGPCLTAPICALNLTSNGSGPHHGWYVKFVEVTATMVNKGCDKHNFEVEQWLATDTSPYELTAIKNDCTGEDVMIDGSDVLVL